MFSGLTPSKTSLSLSLSNTSSRRIRWRQSRLSNNTFPWQHTKLSLYKKARSVVIRSRQVQYKASNFSFTVCDFSQDLSGANNITWDGGAREVKWRLDATAQVLSRCDLYGARGQSNHAYVSVGSKTVEKSGRSQQCALTYAARKVSY